MPSSDASVNRAHLLPEPAGSALDTCSGDEGPEQITLFRIGLRFLDEKKRERIFVYILSLIAPKEQTTDELQDCER